MSLCLLYTMISNQYRSVHLCLQPTVAVKGEHRQVTREKKGWLEAPVGMKQRGGTVGDCLL